MKRTGIGLLGVFALLLSGCSGLTSLGSGSVTPPQSGQITITPNAATLRGTDTQTFSAKISGRTSTAVSWAVNGTVGGSTATGTISSSGLYTAPEFPPTSNVVTITATETADATKSANGAVTLDNPIPQLTSAAPNSIPVGAFTLTINGAHFAAGAIAFFGSTALTTTRVSSTQLTVSGTAVSTQVGNVLISVTNPAPGSIASGNLSAQIVASSGIGITVTPSTLTLHAGASNPFVATVTGSSNQTVTWSITGHGGGDAGVGYMTSQGIYGAPPVPPNPNVITIVATSVADPTKTASATVTLQNPLPVLNTVSPSNFGTGGFLVVATGTGFVKNSVVNFGGQVLTTMYISPTELDATGTIPSTQTGSISVSVSNPDPGAATSSALMAQIVTGAPVVSASSAVRFLEQSTFGPTPELSNQVQETGLDTFLQSQFSAPATVYPAPASTDTNLTNVQNQFFSNAVNNPDQLRQRVAFALNELWVVGENKVSDPTGYTNYMQALTTDALGNYYNVMKDVTLTPAMGHWLDMVNNDLPATGQHANENYARESMQLFTLGLSLLNPDGTQMLDSTGAPIPTYTQNDVMALGRSFTGWTYPTQPGQTLQKHNPSYYGGPMVPFESNHDSGAKTFLGQQVAAGQSAEQELDTVLTIIFNHPNLPPFVCQQLIEKLVTSNPSPAYVQRVSQAFASGKFNTYGSGKRGDMQATVAAILMDPEARRGDSTTTAVAADGKLREPVVMMASIARAFHASTDGTGFTNYSTGMSQSLFNSGSVFNFFPPQSLIPQTTLNGPEFAIFNTNTSLARLNFINSMVYSQISSTTTLNFSPVMNAGTPDQMVDWLNSLFLHGTMSDSMKQSVLTAIGSITVATPPSANDLKTQARTAIYLVTSSSQYQVQR